LRIAGQRIGHVDRRVMGHLVGAWYPTIDDSSLKGEIRKYLELLPQSQWDHTERAP
jgi:hypothetical protein